jgi:hypothetical protein
MISTGEALQLHQIHEASRNLFWSDLFDLGRSNNAFRNVHQLAILLNSTHRV